MRCPKIAFFSVALSIQAMGCGSTGAAPVTPTSESATSPAADPSKPVPPTASNAGKPLTNALVDDMEDGNHKGAEVDQRGGYWYTYKDASSQIAPEGEFKMSEGGASGSKFSARFSGQLGTEQYPYGGMGISLTDPKLPYDVSSCQGVAFSAKAAGDGTTKVRLKVGDWQTVPEGGLCKQCYNDFGGDFLLTSKYQDFTLKFADMKQEPYWGEPKAGIDTKAVYQLQWQVALAGSAFEVWVDNVRFIGCQGVAEIQIAPEPAASTAPTQGTAAPDGTAAP